MAAKGMTCRTRGRSSAVVVLGLFVVAACARQAAAASGYDGYVALPGAALGGVSATLDIGGRAVAGTLIIAAAASFASGDYTVAGKQRGARLIVGGLSSTGTTLRWAGRRTKTSATYKGVARFNGFAGHARARLVLVPRDPASTTCDDEFRGQTMARVLLPVCATCHGTSGVAATTRLRVLADDPTATRNAVALVINPQDPPASRLLQKPIGQLAHGGGAPLAVDGTEIAILAHWVDLVTTGSCGSVTPPAGGGGNGGGDRGATLYSDHCVSCHGTDARGVGGKPLILCNRDIHGPVRSGRNSDTGQPLMPAFPRLTDDDVESVQVYLNTLCPTTTASGADLFAGNCATCHGGDARGESAADIHCARAIGDPVRNGLTGASALMPVLLRLTDPEIQRIQDLLRGFCPLGTATGAQLYASNCAACHDVNGQGDDRRPDIRCAAPSRIASAVRKGRGTVVPVMPRWSTSQLTDVELGSVRNVLYAQCSGTPAALYAANCATCHGPTGSGGRNANGLVGPNVRCESAADLSAAIVEGFGGMPALADLTGAQINAIVSFLRAGCS